MSLKPFHVLSAGGLAAAAGIAYLATRGPGPSPVTRLTELRPGPLMPHVIQADDLITTPVWAPHSYPPRCCPHLNAALAGGLPPGYRIPDPSAAALPAEAMW